MYKLNLSKLGIIGGGRWAIEIIKTLNSFVDQKVSFFIFSKYNNSNLKKKLNYITIRKYFIIESIVDIEQFNLDAIIVANSAKNHFKTSMIALSLNTNTLVEKPVAMTLLEVKRLVNESNKKNNILKVSNIFLFNNYLQNFKKLLQQKSFKIKSLKITWFDKKSEIRNGAIKSYDSTVPIYVDCMHHIVTILSLFTKAKNFSLKKFTFRKGGSHIQLRITNEEIDIDVDLARDKKNRSRKIEIYSKDDKYSSINFSKEPGYIKFKDKKIIADDSWGNSTKPLHKMLQCFLDDVTNKQNNEKLNFKISLESAKICDQIDQIYKIRQSRWMNRINTKNLKKHSKDFLYLIKELNLIKDKFNEKKLEKYINSENL